MKRIPDAALVFSLCLSTLLTSYASDNHHREEADGTVTFHLNSPPPPVAAKTTVAPQHDAMPEAEKTPSPEASVCQGFGPQSPRDIDQLDGQNKRVFTLAPPYQEMNLCNMHFHLQAEHKARDFSTLAKADEHGHGGGFQCNGSKHLSKEELRPLAEEVCHGVKPGDTIEVHWVHSSCDVKPGKGLESCLSTHCSNPDLRVESQVFLVVNDDHALDIRDYAYAGQKINGYYQVKALPEKSGKSVEFAGSTTGPKYNDQVCSPLQVTWSVRPQCAKVSIKSLATWCEQNVFEENHGHGVRKLVTHPELLSEIQ